MKYKNRLIVPATLAISISFISLKAEATELDNPIENEIYEDSVEDKLILTNEKKTK